MSEDVASELSATPVGFIELVLGLPLYWWQDDALAPLADLIDPPGSKTNPLDRPAAKRTTICVRAPNGSGKSERIVAGAILYWLTLHPKGRVVFTTKDSKQLAVQVWPALLAHKSKFPDTWSWVTSPHHRITTATGGSALLFTTNDEGRAEGFHMDFDPFAERFDGPLLIIADEAKNIADRIFTGISRCTFNVLMLISSPGKKVGRFYEAMTKNAARNICVVAGLADCPHIPKSKIDGMIADAPLGIDDPLVRSALFGEWMDSEMRGRFDREGIKHIRNLAVTFKNRRRLARIDPQPGGNGKTVVLVPLLANDPTGWLWYWELPILGCRYLVVCDSASGAEQQKGSDDPDAHAVLVLRDGYIDEHGNVHKPAVIARIIPPCHWFPEVLSERLAWISWWLGGALVAVEANNTGYAILVECKRLGVPLYQRTEGTPENPIRKPGFFQHAYIKPEIIKNLARAIAYRPPSADDLLDQGREQEIDIWDEHIADELSYFVVRPDGTEGAEPGLHDDDVMALAIGKHCLPSGTVYRNAVTGKVGPVRRMSGSVS